MPVKTYFTGQEIPPNEDYAYIIAKDGFYMLKRNGVFESCTWIENIPDLPEQEETFELKAKKIPYQLIKQALAFFYAVYQEHRTEAMVLLCYEDEEWSIYVPEQTVSTGSIKYENNGNRRFAGSIHSHPGFGTTPSNTDDKDEICFDGIHIIIGRFDEVMSEMAVYAVVNGRRFEIEPETIIEDLPDPRLTVSPDWLKKVAPYRETLFEDKGTITIPQPDGGNKNKESIKDKDDEENECCLVCLHEEVCSQDMFNPGSPCEFFDYDQRKAIEQHRLKQITAGG